MRNLFKKQLENDSVVTEEMLENLNVMNYHNGEPIKIGDKVLYALLLGDAVKVSDILSELPMKLITLNEEQFNLYHPVKNIAGEFPVLNIV